MGPYCLAESYEMLAIILLTRFDSFEKKSYHGVFTQHGEFQIDRNEEFVASFQTNLSHLMFSFQTLNIEYDTKIFCFL